MSDIRSFTPLWGEWEIEPISEDRLAIGEGSFGKVYKGVREEFGRRYECAIKHISLPQSNDDVRQLLDEQLSDDLSVASDHYRQIIQDISNEIGIMDSLRGYTNIVAYMDHKIIPKAGGVGYDIFMRMELLTTLFEHVKRNAFTDAVKLGIDICTALEVCAAKNLIHRDIKPQNIFINAEGHYKLGDFGISRQLEKTTGGLTTTGTYAYMAPEVYHHQEYGANVDIYSLGMVLYRLLNGNRLPFLPLEPSPLRYDDDEKALNKRMLGEDMPAPAFADDNLAKIILKMCAFDRNKRYKTATEVKNDLLQIANVPQRVMPMVAPIGPKSLTDDPPSAHESPSTDDDKTVSRFDDIPSYAAPASHEAGNPQPTLITPSSLGEKKKSSAILISGIVLGLVGVALFFRPGFVLWLVPGIIFAPGFVRVLAILIAVAGGVLIALGFVKQKKKIPSASSPTPYPDATEKRTRTMAILGIVFGAIVILAFAFVLHVPIGPTGLAIVTGIASCVLCSLSLTSKKKGLAIAGFVFSAVGFVFMLYYVLSNRFLLF